MESPQKNPLPAFGGALMWGKTFLLDPAGSVLSKHSLRNQSSLAPVNTGIERYPHLKT
jgi:hypothetical protein